MVPHTCTGSTIICTPKEKVAIPKKAAAPPSVRVRVRVRVRGRGRVRGRVPSVGALSSVGLIGSPLYSSQPCPGVELIIVGRVRGRGSGSEP